MFASDSVSLPRLDNPTGACPTHRRQWADFLVSLMAPLHRQYKTARTETRRHLLLKIRQMPTQTSASRGYVLLRGVIRDTHKSPTNCLPGCGHDPRSTPNLEETRNQLQSSGWKKYAHFFPTNAPAAFLQGSGMLCFLQYCLPPKNRVCLL